MRVLASKDSDLMAQDQDLEVLGAVVTARADHEASQGTDREGDQEEHHGMVADRTGFSTPTAGSRPGVAGRRSPSPPRQPRGLPSGADRGLGAGEDRGGSGS